jgi:DNA-binding transcriptional MerR regulator
MNPGKQNGPYRSGELAALSGVSADTIRHYEKLGLLAKPIRSQGGYRLYPSEAPARVQTIRSGLKAGFSLAELAEFFKERDAGGAPCKRVAALAARKIEAIEAQIVELTELRDWLRATLGDWQETLSRTPPGRPARLLESLAKSQNSTRNTVSKGQVNERHHSYIHPVPNDRSSSAKRR